MKCALCHNHKELMNSHIIPEFFYKPLYDDKHRINVFSFTEDKTRQFEQKGMREKLLCGCCETKLSKYEDYVKKVFYGGTRISIQNGKHFKIQGLDYPKFKIFQLSVLYRAAVSNLEFFKNVSLGPHNNKIRDMIYNENPGNKYEYPCSMFIMLMEDRNILDGLIYPPEMMRIDGYRAFRFIFGGCFWVYFVSKNARGISYPELVIDEEGKVKIPLIKALDMPFFNKLSKDLVRHIKI